MQIGGGYDEEQMCRLIFFNLLKTVSKPSQSSIQHLFNDWLVKGKIQSCDWDNAAVAYSNAHSREPPYDCLRNLSSSCCDGRNLMYAENMTATIIESSICGDFMVILDIIYVAIKKEVPFIIVDNETSARARSPLFVRFRHFGEIVMSHIVSDSEGIVEELHIHNTMSKTPNRINHKEMILINVVDMWTTWFTQGTNPNREVAQEMVLVEMMQCILWQQVTVTVSVKEKPNRDGKQPQTFVASIEVARCSYLDNSKTLHIQLGGSSNHRNPLIQAKASTNFYVNYVLHYRAELYCYYWDSDNCSSFLPRSSKKVVARIAATWNCFRSNFCKARYEH